MRVFVDSDEKELKELLRHMDDMRFLIFEEEYFQKGSAVALFNDMDKELTANNFQDLMIVKENDGQVKFKVLEYEGKVKELIMLVNSDDGLVLMNISGNIDLSEMNIITENFNVHKVYDFD